MPYSQESVGDEASSDQKTLSLTNRSASAQNYLQRKYKPITRSLSTKPHMNYRSATAIDFKKNKQVYHQTTGLSLHGSHMVYSSYFLNHQRSKSAVSFKQLRVETPHTEKQHTSSTQSDEDDKPSQSFWTLLRIGMVYFGIEMIFSIEVALAIPLLLKFKVSEELVLSYFVILSENLN
jgi:hypothetical protein